MQTLKNSIERNQIVFFSFVTKHIWSISEWKKRIMHYSPKRALCPWIWCWCWFWHRWRLWTTRMLCFWSHCFFFFLNLSKSVLFLPNFSSLRNTNQQTTTTTRNTSKIIFTTHRKLNDWMIWIRKQKKFTKNSFTQLIVNRSLIDFQYKNYRSLWRNGFCRYDFVF